MEEDLMDQQALDETVHTEETNQVGNGLFSDIQEFKSNLDKVRNFEFGSSTSEEQRISVLENTI